MNSECNGHVFEIDGMKFYRCLLGGDISVMNTRTLGKKCHICHRPTGNVKNGEFLDYEVSVTAVISLDGIGTTKIPISKLFDSQG